MIFYTRTTFLHYFSGFRRAVSHAFPDFAVYADFLRSQNPFSSCFVGKLHLFQAYSVYAEKVTREIPLFLKSAVSETNFST